MPSQIVEPVADAIERRLASYQRPRLISRFRTVARSRSEDPETIETEIRRLAREIGKDVTLVDHVETYWERIQRERRAAIVKRVNLKPGEHDLWATGDEGLPQGILDSNGEVVLGLCRTCGAAECQLDEFPTCPAPGAHALPGPFRSRPRGEE